MSDNRTIQLHYRPLVSRAGYKIEEPVIRPPKPGKPRKVKLSEPWSDPGQTVLSAPWPDAEQRDVWNRYIVRLGDALPIELLDVFAVPGLYRQFADCQTPDDFLAFVSSYGFLRDQHSAREPLADYRKAAEVMRSLVRESKSTADTLRKAGAKSEHVVRASWKWLRDWLAQNQKVFRLLPDLLEADGRARPALFFKPGDLLNALYLQLVQDATGSPDTLSKCPNPDCRNYFYVLPRGGAEKKYCSQECGFHHRYLLRKRSARKKRGKHAR